MSRPVTAATVHPFYDEDDIRRLCGLAIFAQADAMQRAGHVSGAERTSDTISGDVRGTWRRVDRVTIQTKGNRLQPECTRHGVAFCRHAGALLLHWLRVPAAVRIAQPAARMGLAGLAGAMAELGIGDLDVVWDDDLSLAANEPVAPETAEEEIARLLEGETIAFIREVARRRGVRVSGTRKADVVRDAAAGLADQANIDAAIAGLSPSERLMLNATHLSSGAAETTDTRAFDIYRMLGGSGQPPLDGLREVGLVSSPEATYYRGRVVQVPLSVIARLPAMEGLATPLPPDKLAAVPEGRNGLELVPLLTIVAQDSQTGSGPSYEGLLDQHYVTMPAGFVVHPADQERLLDLIRTYNGNERVRLVPTPAMPPEESARLALRTKQPDEIVEFVVRLMISLGIAEYDPRLLVEQEMLRRVLELDASKQLELLVGGWLSVIGWAESGLIFGDGGPIRFVWNPRHVAPHVKVAVAEGSSLVARLVSRMPVGQWFDTASLAETVDRLGKSGAPSLASFRQAAQHVDFTWHGQPRPGQRLALRTPEGWALFLRAIADATLRGPMAWLGLVDSNVEAGRVTAFRVRPSIALLSGRSYDAGDLAASGAVSVSDDLAIVVPAGSASIAALGSILRACELTQVGDDGLHYRLSPNGLQALFESGMNAAEIERLLSDQLEEPLPKGARKALYRWWASYGTVRLYDELTLVELGDDLLLRELQAATSLRHATLHQFTPRLIAVADDAVDALVAELETRGYAPRIVEGG